MIPSPGNTESLISQLVLRHPAIVPAVHHDGPGPLLHGGGVETHAEPDTAGADDCDGCRLYGQVQLKGEGDPDGGVVGRASEEGGTGAALHCRGRIVKESLDALAITARQRRAPSRLFLVRHGRVRGLGGLEGLGHCFKALLCGLDGLGVRLAFTQLESDFLT